jgi:hypothetical protein
MDIVLLLIAISLAVFALYRRLSRWLMTPKMRVRVMLWRYRRLARSGLSEQDCLVHLLATRKDWKRLPHRFLAEIVSRFPAKEGLMRFVSVSEDFHYQRDPYPGLAANSELEAAMGEIACLFSRLQPDQYFTNLPLAANYHETGRHADALPLFERGLAQVRGFEKDAGPAAPEFPPPKSLGTDTKIMTLRNRYKKMYEACLKATEREKETGYSSPQL